MLFELSQQLLLCHECNLSDLFFDFFISIWQVKVTHIIIGIKNLVVKHLGEQSLLCGQLRFTKLIRRNEVTLPVDPYIEKVTDEDEKVPPLKIVHNCLALWVVFVQKD